MNAPEKAVAMRAWPEEGYTRVPYWVFNDPGVYAREQTDIFRGKAWHFLGFECEVPEVGSYKTTFVGDMPIIMTRAEDGSVNAMLNRCAHRGNMVCREAFGKAKELYCVYHAWIYNMKGDLTAAAFRKGIKGVGGLPPDFKLQEHGLKTLRVANFHGLVFATFSQEVEPFEEWVGDVGDGMRRVLKAPLKVLGYDTQRIKANWKAYHENPRDAYHANILHTFYGTFGLSRQSQESRMVLDKAGRHVYFYTKAGTDQNTADYKETASTLRSHNDNYTLEDKSLLKRVDEFGDGISIQILTLYPTFVMHQISNSLATRQLIPRGPHEADLVWTYFGYAADTEEMTRMRLAQANLAGSAGIVSVEDAAVCEMIDRAIGDAQEGESFIEMGGKTLDSGGDTKLSERALRNFWNVYRQDMGL